MKDELFRKWLESVDRRPIAQVRDNIARVRRIEQEMRNNLDIEYGKDCCVSVIEDLNVDNTHLLNQTRLPRKMEGLSSLKTAVRKYVKFCGWHSRQP
ncbi:MAG: hypothetical protein LBU53_00870 [Zoogloeaceae bacterium]|jgi:hypothetical protein|nr:hypothetical protein [Zoogloeaceae bacterium]